MSTAATITIAVLAFFTIMALIVLARVLLRNEVPRSRYFRVGVFVERDTHLPSPPPGEEDTLVMRPH